MSKKKILTYIGGPLLSLVILTATAFAINSITEGYRVPAGATKVKVTSSSGCQAITNSGSSDIFVPTNTTNEWSAFLANKPSYVTTGACANLPTAPQNLTGVMGSQQVTLNWSAPADNGGEPVTYNVYRSSPSNTSYSKILSGTSNMSYTNSNLTTGVTYYYKVSASNSAGEGPLSAEFKTSQYMSVKYTFAGANADFTCTPYITGTNNINYTGTYTSKNDAIHATKRSLESCLISSGYVKSVYGYHPDLGGTAVGYTSGGSCTNTSRYGCSHYAFYALTSASYDSTVRYSNYSGTINNFWHQDFSAITMTWSDSYNSYIYNGIARLVDYNDVMRFNDGTAQVNDYPAESIHLLTTKCSNSIVPFDVGTINCSKIDATVPTYLVK